MVTDSNFFSFRLWFIQSEDIKCYGQLVSNRNIKYGSNTVIQSKQIILLFINQK